MAQLNSTGSGIGAADHNPNAPANPMSWSPVNVTARGDIPAIKNHTATVVGSKIYIFGGYDGKSNHNTMHVLDCTTYEWKTLRNVGLYRDEATGRSLQPEGRNGHTATLAEGQLWILGGWLGHGPLAAKDLWVFDTVLHEWVQPEVYGEKPGPCNMHTCDYLPHKHQLLLFRGGDGRSYLNELHSFDLNTQKWSPINPNGRLPVPRANHASALVGEQLYVFGGWDGKKRLNDIHILNTRADPPEWSTPSHAGECPAPRAGMTLTNVRGRIYMFGGSGPHASCFDDVQVFDPVTECWLKTTRIDEDNRAGAGGTVAGGEEAIVKARKDAEVNRNRIEDLYNRNRLVFATNTVYTHNNTSANTDSTGIGNITSGTSVEVEVGAYGEGNPNAEPPVSEITLLRKGPQERAGHTATLVGRKILIFGGSQSNKRRNYFNDFYELDTDPAPEIVVNNYHSSLTRFRSELSKFFDNESLADIVFIVEGKEIFAHKVILCAMSERFRGLFLNKFREEKQKEIVVEDVSYQAFLMMLEYLYTGVPPELLTNFVEEVSGTRLPLTSGNAATIENLPPSTTQNLQLENANETNFDSDSDSEFSTERPNVNTGDRQNRLRSSATNADISRLETDYRRLSMAGKVQLVNSQNMVKISGEQLSLEYVKRIELVAELLSVSDRYMLDHLKQICEKSLEKVISLETVDILLQVSDRSNAEQLKNRCLHFMRNYLPNDTSNGATGSPMNLSGESSTDSNQVGNPNFESNFQQSSESS